MASNIQLTKQQERAISLRGRNILVSAAAGSGKTSVLTQRIFSLIREGGDIRRMLICTFTNLATVQMRDRIARVLEENAGDDIRLRAQAEYVDRADICTIHKFAIKVVKEHLLELGLSTGVHIGGEDELAVIKAQAMKEAFLKLGDAPELEELRIKYTKRTDQRLVSLLDQIYQFMSSRPEREKWLEKMAGEDMETKLCSLYWERAAAQADQVLYTLEECLAWSRETGEEKQAQRDEEDITLIKRIIAALGQKDAAEYASILAGEKLRDVCRGLGKTSLADRKSEARKLYRKMQQQADAQIEQKLCEEARYLKKEMQKFHTVIQCFHKEFTRLKTEKKLMDYDDTLHYAYRLLQKEEIAQEYRERYDAVFIDEYQDTNPIQEAILKQVSREDNRFMVGDMKQSIYRFRLADPLIFREKAEEFSGEGTRDAVIYMNDNFRSAAEVINPVNVFMERMMSKKLGEIDYTEEERLVCAGTARGKTEFLLSQADTEVMYSKQEQEARIVAEKILRLRSERIQDGEGEREIQFGDICLLLRKKKELANSFAKIFTQYGIPYCLDTGATEDAPEIEIFVNLLKLIDNQIGDIELLSVLRSHIGGFTETDFVRIRLADRAASFAQAFFHYAQEPDELGEKARRFLEKLDRFRLYAKNLTLQELLFRVRNETAYDAVLEALPGGGARAAQFDYLLEKCLDAPDYAKENLFSLLHYLDQVKKEKGSYTEWKEGTEQAGAVQILSIHGSKGLEFPVVILAGTGGQFNTTDLTREVLIHSQLGLAVDWKDAATLTSKKTATKSLFAYTLEQELKSEELRILYVAMTRAKNRLILSGQAKDTEKALLRAQEKKNWYQLTNAVTPLEWMLTAFAGRPDIIELQKVVPEERKEKKEKATEATLKELVVPVEKRPFDTWGKEQVPSKIGVSSLKPEFLPEERPIYSHRKDSGAQFGTLVHAVLKRLGFKPAGKKEAESEIDAMLSRRLILPEQAEQLKRNWKLIVRFSQSELAARANKAKRIGREIPFSLAKTAKELGLGESEESVIVQGIIDLFFEEEDGLVLVDYKTDRTQEDGTLLPGVMERYSAQLGFYQDALESITGKRVKGKYLYLLRSGREIRVDF